MANTAHQGFSALPAELRLEVYKRILASSIAEGHPRCSAGLYHTCVTTRNEMDEYLDRVLLIVRLQNYWMTASKSGHPIHVYLPTTCEFTTPLEDATLQIPVSNERNPSEDRIDLTDLCYLLDYISRLQLSSFTLKFYHPLPARDVSWRSSIEQAMHTLQNISSFRATEQPYLQDVGRLMIDLGTLAAPRSIGEIGRKDIYRFFRTCNFIIKADIWWLGMKGTEWTLCFHLKAGLPPPVDGFGRRWTLGPHIMSEWDKEHPEAQ